MSIVVHRKDCTYVLRYHVWDNLVDRIKAEGLGSLVISAIALINSCDTKRVTDDAVLLYWKDMKYNHAYLNRDNEWEGTFDTIEDFICAGRYDRPTIYACSTDHIIKDDGSLEFFDFDKWGSWHDEPFNIVMNNDNGLIKFNDDGVSFIVNDNLEIIRDARIDVAANEIVNNYTCPQCKNKKLNKSIDKNCWKCGHIL